MAAGNAALAVATPGWNTATASAVRYRGALATNTSNPTRTASGPRGSDRPTQSTVELPPVPRGYPACTLAPMMGIRRAIRRENGVESDQERADRHERERKEAHERYERERKREREEADRRRLEDRERDERERRQR